MRITKSAQVFSMTIYQMLVTKTYAQPKTHEITEY